MQSKAVAVLVPAILLALGGLLGCARVGSEAAVKSPVSRLSVAAAADLKFAFDEMLAAFQKNYPEVEVRVTYGSSGNFFAQLTNQAPFDLFFSADMEYPRRLVEQGLASPESIFRYAVGHLVVWVPRESALAIEKRGLQALLDPAVGKIALANPRHAPYGRAAEAALKRAGLYEKLQDRLVFGEHVAQTAQFVAGGSAEVGFIPLSLALAPQMRARGRYWEIPRDAYPPLEQGGVILSWTRNAHAARALRDFIVGEQGQTILQRFGFR